MAIKYFICQDPPRRDGKPAARHMQVKDLTPADNEDVAKRIQRINNLLDNSVGAAVLIDLRRALAELLSEGCSIHLNGIGTLVPKVSGKIGAPRKGDSNPRVDNLTVSGVDFQPDATFLDAVNRHAKFEHLPEPRTSVGNEELRTAVARYLSDHDAITTGQLSQLLHISRDRARMYLNQLVADGVLRREGVRATVRFVKKMKE